MMREEKEFGKEKKEKKKKKEKEVTGSPADEGFLAEHEGAFLCAEQDIYQVFQAKGVARKMNK